jgi:hypothetical protein
MLVEKVHYKLKFLPSLLMKHWMLFYFLCASLTVVAQKPLKKKLLGEYVGKIAAYKLNGGSQLIDVASTEISVKLRKTDLDFAIGRNEMTVPYTWVKKDKTTFIVSFNRAVDESPETLLLYKKTKSMKRIGLFPQPDVELEKRKRKQ